MFHVQAWVCTRRLWLLAEGVPAVAATVGVALLVIGQFRGPDRELIARYDLEVERALARQDVAAAKVYARKLVLLDELGPRTRYALARVAEHEGELDRARRLMSELALETGGGYPPAHFWLAQQTMRQTAGGARIPAGVVIHHLEQSLRSTDDRQQAHEWLADLYAARQDLAEAAEHLEEAAPRRPELYLQLAEIQACRKDDVRFRRAAKQAVEYFRQRVERQADDVEARIGWARVNVLDKDEAEAEKILREGLAMSDDARLREALARVYLARADRLAGDTPQELGERLELLTKALHSSPHHVEALNRLAAFVRRTDPSAYPTRAVLKDLLAKGQNPAAQHLVLGSAAAAEGKWEEARLHLEQAYRVEKRLPALLSNLAWVLANGEPPELERSLSLTDAALELAPDDPEVRGTRGQILARLQRWPDAVADLEAALPAASDPAALHDVLGEAYAALGDVEMAERHRALAAKVRPRPKIADTAAENGEKGGAAADDKR